MHYWTEKRHFLQFFCHFFQKRHFFVTFTVTFSSLLGLKFSFVYNVTFLSLLLSLFCHFLSQVNFRFSLSTSNWSWVSLFWQFYHHFFVTFIVTFLSLSTTRDLYLLPTDSFVLECHFFVPFNVIFLSLLPSLFLSLLTIRIL